MRTFWSLLYSEVAGLLARHVLAAVRAIGTHLLLAVPTS